MAEKLPDQLFVTFLKYSPGTTSHFSNPINHSDKQMSLERTASFVVRMDLQRSIKTPGGQWCARGVHFDYQTRQNVPYDHPIGRDVVPQIWDNIPTVGFEIFDTGARERGRKIFKVIDPRNEAKIEISSQSLFGLVMDGEIKGGKILSPCQWKSGKMLVVA